MWEALDPGTYTVTRSYADVELSRLPASVTTVKGGHGDEGEAESNGKGKGEGENSASRAEEAVCLLVFGPKLLRSVWESMRS